MEDIEKMPRDLLEYMYEECMNCEWDGEDEMWRGNGVPYQKGCVLIDAQTIDDGVIGSCSLRIPF